MSENQKEIALENSIDIVDVVKLLLNKKWIVLSVSVLFSVMSLAWSLGQPNIYRSEVLLAPSEALSGKGSDFAGQFGGLAQLAGVDIGGGGVNRIELALQILKSRDFIMRVVKESELAPYILAVDSYDRETDSFVFDKKIYDKKLNKWFKYNTDSSTPSSMLLHKKFLKKMELAHDERSGLVFMSFKSESPIFARKILSLIVEEINAEMKQRDVSQASVSIEYLNRQLAETSVGDLRQIFYGLIEEQTKKMMLANVHDGYAFDVIDSPSLPERKYKPNRLMILILGGFFGAIFASGIVLVYGFREG